MQHDELDPHEVGLFAYQVFTNLQGAVTAGMIHLGDRLGLYSALAEADGSLSSAELADATGLHERWVREWAYNQGAAHLVEVDVDERTGGDRPERRHVAHSPSPISASYGPVSS